MIYPTRRSVLLMAAGVPVCLVVAVAAPSLWSVALVWVLAVLALMALDGWMAPSARSAAFSLQAPGQFAAVSGAEPAALTLAFAGKAPRRVEATLATNPKLAAAPVRARAAVDAGTARLGFQLSALRRGEGRIEQAWARWTGPLGLVHLQASRALDHVAPVLPNVRRVQEEAMRLISRDALFGQKSQIELGEGSEFHALREFQPGMDVRAIDWKQSSRHGALLSKEYRTERNHPVMLVVDSGRLMGEPVAGAPKLDHALNAALLLAYVGLKAGDRIGLSAFDSKPRMVSKAVAGAGAFPLLQRLAAGVDYSAEETNFTLGLSTVAGGLDRRALVVIFTDFADVTSAQLMLESAGRLTERHLVLFVLFADEELQALTRHAPAVPADVSRAVVADALLRERELVIARLRRLGAEVVEARVERVGPALVERYLALKRRDRL